MGCFSGRLMSSASDQKLFCKLCSLFCCSFNEFVEEKVISPSYSSAILTPPLLICFNLQQHSSPQTASCFSLPSSCVPLASISTHSLVTLLSIWPLFSNFATSASPDTSRKLHGGPLQNSPSLCSLLDLHPFSYISIYSCQGTITIYIRVSQGVEHAPACLRITG